jgi:hypothetical protein
MNLPNFHKLLVVDWDFFFMDKAGSDDREALLYDWGHREAPFFIETLWPNRAEGFIGNNLPLPGTTGEEIGFWNRFRFDPHAKLYFAESNSRAINTTIVSATDYFTQVWLYDAHHDAGYRHNGQTVRKLTTEGRWTCEDWMVLYSAIGAKLHVRYPTWKTWAFEMEPKPMVRVDRKFDDGKPPALDRRPITFDRVFVCRSGAWVPSWLDANFKQFIDACPVQDRTCLDGELPRREFSLEEVHRGIAERNEMFARLKEMERSA